MNAAVPFVQDEELPGRRLWLMTLADLFMLLVGFYVFLQANQTLDGGRLAAGLRAGFGIAANAAPMPVESAAIGGFAPGSAELRASPAEALAWAREAARDPRITITLVGQTDGSPADVDPATRSAAILAADRARTAAAALSQVVAPERLRIETAQGGSRGVLLHIGFAGGKALPPGNAPLPATTDQIR